MAISLSKPKISQFGIGNVGKIQSIDMKIFMPRWPGMVMISFLHLPVSAQISPNWEIEKIVPESPDMVWFLPIFPILN